MSYQRCLSSRKWQLLQQRRVQNKYHTCQKNPPYNLKPTLSQLCKNGGEKCELDSCGNAVGVLYHCIRACHCSRRASSTGSLLPPIHHIHNPDISIRTRLLFSKIRQIWFQRMRNPSTDCFLRFHFWVVNAHAECQSRLGLLSQPHGKEVILDGSPKLSEIKTLYGQSWARRYPYGRHVERWWCFHIKKT